jgi:hypothetical protein
MSKIPPGRYGSENFRQTARIDAFVEGAPVEFDTFSEVAAELQRLRLQIAAIEGGSHEFQFLLLE